MFKSETIRTVWDKEKQKYYISAVDEVGIKIKQSYLRKLKQRLKEEENETMTNCHAF